MVRQQFFFFTVVEGIDVTVTRKSNTTKKRLVLGNYLTSLKFTGGCKIEDYNSEATLSEDQRKTEIQTKVTSWNELSVPAFYNKHAGYIDRTNKQVMSLLPAYRSMNWNSMCAVALLGVSMVNSFHLFNKFQSSIPLKQYCRKAEDILSPPVIPPSIDEPDNHKLKLIIESNVGQEILNSGNPEDLDFRTRICVICTKSKSNYYCPACQSVMHIGCAKDLQSGFNCNHIKYSHSQKCRKQRVRCIFEKRPVRVWSYDMKLVEENYNDELLKEDPISTHTFAVPVSNAPMYDTIDEPDDDNFVQKSIASYMHHTSQSISTYNSEYSGGDENLEEENILLETIGYQYEIEKVSRLFICITKSS